MIDNQVTKLDEKYEPSPKLRKFVAAMLSPETKGCKTEAERITGFNRKSFYRQYKYNDRFREWFNREVDMFSETLSAKCLAALSEMIEDTKDPYARIQAIRTWAEMAGKIKVNNIQIDNRSVSVTWLSLAEKAREISPQNGEKQ